MDKILTVNDVAGILQVKAITVREMFRESRLRGFKVGKAWRTTQQMLEQDIAALARGESPAAVAASGPPSPPAQEAAVVKEALATATAAESDVPAAAAVPAEEIAAPAIAAASAPVDAGNATPSPVATRRARRPVAATGKVEESPDAYEVKASKDDTQQLLF